MILPTHNANLDAEQLTDDSLDRNANPRSNQKSTKEFESFAEEREATRATPTRTIDASLVVTLGGSGGQVASRTKKLLVGQGTDHFARFVAIDTDETTQSGAPGCPSFGDNEFIHIKTSRVRNVIENPKAHKKIVEQTGLDDQQQHAFHERLTREGIEHAGQVRSFGYLAMLSDLAAIKSALKNAISDLTSAHAALKKQLASKTRIVVRQRISIYVIFSNSGGTGGSMVQGIMALLRSLTIDLQVEIVAMMIMPSAFESVLDGKPQQAVRIGSNAFACMLEMDAARNGFYSKNRITFGTDERDEVAIPAGLFNQLNVVGRYLADGRDLRTLDAVYDALAMYLAAILGTEISDRVDSDEPNQATALEPDPTTGMSRYVGSLAATSLALPDNRIARNCAATQLVDFVRDRAIGAKLEQDKLLVMVDGWLNNPLGGGNVRLESREFPGGILRVCLPNPSAVVRQLYRVMNGNQRLYFANGLFVQNALRLQSQFKEVQLPGTETKFAEMSSSITKELVHGLTKTVSTLALSNGWLSVQQFCTSLSSKLASLAERLEKDAESDLVSAKNAFAQFKEALVPLQSRWKSWFVDKKRQDRVAALYQSTVSSALSNLAKLAALRIVTSMQVEVENQLKIAERTLEGAKRTLLRAKADVENSRAGTSLTTNSLVELDISIPDTDRRVLESHRMDSDVLLERICSATKCKSTQALRQLVTQPNGYESVFHGLVNYFLGKLADYSVADELAIQLQDPRREADARARIRQAVLSCQPMWRAESGQFGVEFADSMIVGVPNSAVEANRSLVETAILEFASQRIHANGQYNGGVAPVVSGDKNRIYLIRRSSGACLHYLPDVARAKADYDQWHRNGGHPVHIYNQQTVMKMAPVLPQGEPDEGELAFALGVAWGWLANRGPHWYDNLSVSDTDPNKLVCRLASHWNGVAFQDMALATDCRSLNSLVQTGRLVYQLETEPLPTQKLGGLEDAFDSVCHNGEWIELVMKTFDDLRVVASDVQVAADLDRYIVNLKRRVRPNDTNFALMMKMVEHLTQQVNRLRNMKN